MKYKLFIGLWWFTQLIFGQDILPFIENYSKQNYKGDNQIWSLTQGTDNALYFANNRFLLRYNGVKWEKYTLPNNTVIRSVFAYENKIYSGSYNEFGFWQREKGKMRYYSLVPDQNFFAKDKSEEIWKIFEWHKKIYFQTFNELYEYDFKKVKKIVLPGFTSYSFLVNDELLIATVDKGIYKLKTDTFYNVEPWNKVKGQVLHHIAAVEDKTYIFTKNNGIYVADENKILPWNSPLQNDLKKQLINTALVIDSLHIAVGTASNGLYLIDLEDNSFVNFNKNSGLQNNSVLNIILDKEKDLWLGLDNGIAHIEINSPYRLYTDKTGTLGSVYAMAPLENGLLLGSNHGLFRYSNKELTLVENSQGQIWDIYKSGQKYVIGHNDGTFLYQNNLLKKESSINGGWKFKKNLYQDAYIQSNYTGIAFYESLDLLAKGKKMSGFTGPIKDFIQISPDEIIGSHAYKGLLKFKFDKQYQLVTEENITQKNGLTNDFGVKIFPFKNDVLYFIDHQWYYYDHIQNKLLLHESFNQYFSGITDIIPIDDTNFGIVKNDILYIVTSGNQDFKWFAVPSKVYAGRIINNETKIVKIDEKFYINLDDGFLIVSKWDTIYKEQNILVEAFYNNDIIGHKKIPYNKSVQIDFILPYFGNEKIPLYYALNNGPISSVLDGQLNLTNLNSGSYILNVFYKKGSDYQKIKDFEFEVKVPWYFSYWMIWIYLTVLGLILYVYYKWNKIRFIEKLKLKEEEIKHKSEFKQLEIETENKLKIQEYEKHILENQVQLKANELAGKSLSLAKQTELIESIQEILQKENDLHNVKNKIAKSIKINRLNKNEWKSFENNLLKSNEDFVKILTSKFPQLTSKDIKLCIYLKMNLSSKEIAPLMNISYRGVELHRYRLRKKLSLDKDENLNTYLTNLY